MTPATRMPNAISKTAAAPVQYALRQAPECEIDMQITYVSLIVSCHIKAVHMTPMLSAFLEP